MKKVVYISNFNPIPPIKGAAVQTWINEVAKRLMFFEPHTISIDDEFLPLKEYKDGVFHHRIHISRVYERIFQKILGLDVYSYNDRIFTEIKRIKPDIIHFQNYHHDLDKLATRIKKWNANIKLIFHLHNIYNFKDKHFPKFDAVIGASDFISDYFKNDFKTDDRRTIYNGVDVKKFNRDSNLKKDADKINVCSVGRVAKDKNIEFFIELADKFKNDAKYDFFIVGEISAKGYKHYDYFEGLQAKISELNLKNIQFLGSVAPDKINNIYSFADFAVLPFGVNEAFGMTAIEAMSCGAFVVAHAGGGAKEYMQDGVNSRLCSLENFAEEAAKILRETSEQDLQKIRANARKMVEERFSWEKIAFDTEKLYKEIMND